MPQPPKVLLKFLGISLEESEELSMDFAVLGGTIAVLLGGEDSAAEKLTAFAAGTETPRKGKVLTGSEMAPASSKEGKQSTGYITGKVDVPPGMTVRGSVALTVSSSSRDQKKSAEITDGLLNWLDLDRVASTPVEDLETPVLQRTAMALAMALSPELLILNCPVHDSLHRRLKEFAAAGNAVLIRASTLGEIPFGVERIALCDRRGVVNVVRHSELRAKSMGGAEISVSFYPSLPRAQLEKIHGLRNLLHKDGSYRFTHSDTIYAVTQIMNLARANSRVVAELHIAPVPPESLIRLFEGPHITDNAPGNSLFEEESF
ncbi:hypothetical protein CSA37_02015 [Candidatus Fermentibacteria bacterium]|nr:MAG: hypothetical protein CSA37_02015 [Candidatus Fermentibacteria bacterium]